MMLRRKVFMLISMLIFGISYAQNNPVNLILDERMPIEKVDDVGLYECKLALVKNGKTDYYSFSINTDESKNFESNAFEFNPNKSKLTTIDELATMTPCEVHDFLSSGTTYLIRKNKQGDGYVMWIAVYTGTVRDTVFPRKKNKI